MMVRADFNTEPRRILTEELTRLRERITANILAEGANATGRTLKSLEVVVTMGDDGWEGNLYARPYFATLETGAGPWKNQYPHPPKFFREIIEEWAKAKGLTLNSYLVARKIMREGTALHRKGGRDTIYSREIPTAIDRIEERLAFFWQSYARDNIHLNTK